MEVSGYGGWIEPLAQPSARELAISGRSTRTPESTDSRTIEGRDRWDLVKLVSTKTQPVVGAA
jgi:hypothetical protein